MDLGLEGKVLLIAESDERHMAALSRSAKREGAVVALCSPEGEAAGAEADAVFSCDLTDIGEAERLRGALNERFGRLDAVYFHRDAVEPGGVMDTDAAGFQRRILPARAAFVCCKVFGAYIGSLGRGGAIVLATSLHDEKPNGLDLAHSVAQGMIGNLAMEAALELGDAGVRVNQLSIGAMEGDDARFASDISSFYDGCLYKVPGGRLGSSEDLASAALFLLSERAGFINGARVRLDGGLALHYVDPKANYRAALSHQSPPPEFVLNKKKKEKRRKKKDYMKARPLEGRTAVVTGAGKGIGMGIARELALAGASVVVNYSVSAEGAENVCAGIRERGGLAVPFRADVSREDEVIALMQHAVDRTGRLDILVCNAALQANLTLPNYDMETYGRVVDVNLLGYFLCTREAARHMIPRKKGVILYNSSVHAKRPTHFDPVYCMTKGGIKMLEREAAIELAQHGIRVVCMEPGGVRIDAPKSGSAGPFLDRQYLTGTRHFRFKRTHCLGRCMEPYDVGRMAVLLASDDCELISGCEVTMDGADMLL